MPILINSNTLTFDDILLVPQFSDLASRKDVDISTNLFGVSLPVPICSANMDTVTETAMAEEMFRLGGIGFLHRYAPYETIFNWLKEIHDDKKSIAIPSIGVKDSDLEWALKYADYGVLGVNIDIAHGDSKHMLNMIEKLAKEDINVIAGNVATREGARRLANAGAKVIKVGIGPGSLCTTRIITGHGVPQLTAIMECASIKKAYGVTIIADGGIRNSGDIVKALAFGADLVMVGSLLAGTAESPGKLVELTNEKGLRYHAKEYRGMASRAARDSVSKTDSSYTPEGESTFVKYKGPVQAIVRQLEGGIRSGFSYSGAHNLQELQENAEYVVISGNGMAESKPHLITR